MAIHRPIARPTEIYSERVAGKTVLYLDTNVWSDLSEARTAETRTTRDLLLDLYSRGLVVCPLAFATITELLKRQVNSDSLRQAELMDTLSDGVSFRGTKHIRDLEVVAACDFMNGTTASPVRQAFTVVACYIEDKRLAFADGWSEAAVDDFMAGLRKHGLPHARWLQQQMRTPAVLDTHASTDDKYVREISRKRVDALTWAVTNSRTLDEKAIRIEEHTAVLNRYIFENVLRVVEPSVLVRIAGTLQRLQTEPETLAAVVRAMPSTWLSCEMNVQRVLAKDRRTRKQDFYDHEHAVMALPYTDAFVTSDGGILDVLRKVRATEAFACRLVRGTANLGTYLNDLRAA